MSLDIMVRTPIIPGRCKQCAIRARGSRRAGEDSLDSPQLPWCPHGSDSSDGSGLLLPRALKLVQASAANIKRSSVKEAMSIEEFKSTGNPPRQETIPCVDIEVRILGRPMLFKADTY